MSTAQRTCGYKPGFLISKRVNESGKALAAFMFSHMKHN